MKLRLQANSLRLRLKKGEVDQLARTGRVEEAISLAAGGDVFRYVLEASPHITKVRARLKSHGIYVEAPASDVAEWASGDQVGIEGTQAADGAHDLQILIEKDFACLNGSDEQNFDTFANPLAGTKC